MSRNTARSSAFSTLALIAYSIKTTLRAGYLLLIRIGHIFIGTQLLHLHPSARAESNPDVLNLVTIGKDVEASGAAANAKLNSKEQQIMVRLPHILPGLPPICLN